MPTSKQPCFSSSRLFSTVKRESALQSAYFESLSGEREIRFTGSASVGNVVDEYPPQFLERMLGVDFPKLDS